jgi:hypothetical protein
MSDNDKNASDNIKASGGVGVGKEEEPVVSGAGLKETPSEHRELEKRKEAREYIKEIPLRPKIPPEVERAGVKHVPAPAPIIKKGKKKIQLPLTDDQIVVGLHAHIWESIKWLAVWCVRKLKKAHVAVKEIHGRLVRN